MSVHLLSIFIQGVALGVGLCCTLGPQSIFVLRQGMRCKAAIEVAMICSIADLVLIAAGAAGFGTALAAFPSLARFAGWCGAAFICAYGGKLLLDVLNDARIDREASRGRSCAIATAFALSVLNPQVYLEMIGVVGSVAVRFASGDRAMFAFGVMLVSPLWFFGLAVGGRRLATLAGSRRALRVVDLATAMLMLGLGALFGLAEVARR
jgi:L-lysine exporter family protein LysE/ArgO